jgi:hypothetical protein
MKGILTSAALVASLVLSGCTVQMTPKLDRLSESKHVFTKNYEIGVQSSGYVGNPIVKVKDIYVTRTESSSVKPSSDFTAMGGNVVQIVGSADQTYPVVATTEYDDVKYEAIRVQAINGYPLSMLVDSEGTPSKKVINNNIVMIYDFVITPPDLKFIKGFNEEVDLKSGYTNYELVYGGTDGQSIKLTYREFSPDDMARQAFFQELVYPLGTQRIRFKNLAIQIHSADSERIVFTVLEDGY